MIEQDQWVFFREIDWECPNNNRFNIDTRDFHSGYFWSDTPHQDWSTIQKYDRFFFTRDELVETLERLFIDSGGEAEWRFLSLDTYPKGWKLKYLRIYRTDQGFVICDDEHKALRKEIFEGKIREHLLNTH